VSYEHCIKRVRERDWRAVQTAWLDEVGKLVLDPPGRAPDGELRESPTLISALGFPNDKSEHRADVVGLRASMLHEGLYLLHKAGSVLVSAHDQATSGCATWSLATSYQAGLFAAEAILHFLGVSIVSLESRHFIVDAWPPAEKSISKTQLKKYKLGSEVHLIRLSSSVNHFHRWALLQRVLNTCSNLPFDKSIVQAICDLEDKDFAAQRNDLHYATSWCFSDLHGYVNTPSEFLPVDRSRLLNCLEVGSQAFGFALGTTLFLLGLKLLTELAVEVPQIEAERNLLLQACAMPRMKLRAPYEELVA